MNEYFNYYLEEHPLLPAKLSAKRYWLPGPAKPPAPPAKTSIRKGVLDGASMPGKLADCSSKDPAIPKFTRRG